MIEKSDELENNSIKEDSEKQENNSDYSARFRMFVVVAILLVIVVIFTFFADVFSEPQLPNSNNTVISNKNKGEILNPVNKDGFNPLTKTNTNVNKIFEPKELTTNEQIKKLYFDTYKDKMCKEGSDFVKGFNSFEECYKYVDCQAKAFTDSVRSNRESELLEYIKSNKNWAYSKLNYFINSEHFKTGYNDCIRQYRK